MGGVSSMLPSTRAPSLRTLPSLSLQLCQVSLDAIEPQKAQLMITDRLSLQGLQTLLLEEYGESSPIPLPSPPAVRLHGVDCLRLVC